MQQPKVKSGPPVTRRDELLSRYFRVSKAKRELAAVSVKLFPWRVWMATKLQLWANAILLGHYRRELRRLGIRN